MPVNVEEAELMIDEAIKTAETAGVRIAAIVVDEAGLPVAARRMEGTLPWAWQVAEAKAVGSALWRRDGDYIQQVAEERPVQLQQLNSLPILRGLPLIPARGSLVIQHENQMLGAIGVSGGSAEGDKKCAQAALEALAVHRNWS